MECKFGIKSLVAMLAMLSVASCGGGSSPSGGSGPKTVTVTHWGVPPAVVTAPPYLADYWGYFKDEGIQIDYVNQPSGVTLVQAMLSGDLDFVSTATEIPMILADQGQQVRAIVGVNNRPTLAILVPANSTISKVQDFKGKRIGVAGIGSAQHNAIKVLFKDNGMDAATDATVIPVGIGSTAVAAFKNKQIDILIASDPAIQLLTFPGDAKIILDMRKGEGGRLGKVPCCSIVATQNYIEKNPDIVHRVVRAMARTLKRAHDHPDQALAAYRTFGIFKTLDDAVLKDAVYSVAQNLTPVLTRDDIKISNDIQLVGGSVKTSHSFDQVVATQFQKDWEAKY